MPQDGEVSFMWMLPTAVCPDDMSPGDIFAFPRSHNPDVCRMAIRPPPAGYISFKEPPIHGCL